MVMKDGLRIPAYQIAVTFGQLISFADDNTKLYALYDLFVLLWRLGIVHVYNTSTHLS